MIQQRFHFILNLTLNFNSLKDKKPRDIRCNEIKQSFSDSKFDHKWAPRLLLWYKWNIIHLLAPRMGFQARGEPGISLAWCWQVAARGGGGDATGPCPSSSAAPSGKRWTRQRGTWRAWGFQPGAVDTFCSGFWVGSFSSNSKGQRRIKQGGAPLQVWISWETVLLIIFKLGTKGVQQFTCLIYLLSFFFASLHFTQILFPWPGIESMPPAV